MEGVNDGIVGARALLVGVNVRIVEVNGGILVLLIIGENDRSSMLLVSDE